MRTDDGVLLHTEVDDVGSSHVTVVLVHGFAARHEEFAAQRDALRTRARLILFDQRGHGASGWAGRRAATMSRLGRDLYEVLDAVAGPAPVVLVGHSMGAMAVMSLAEQRPELFGERVHGVALLSTSAQELRDEMLPRAVARLVPGTAVTRGLLRLVLAVVPLIDRVHPFQTRAGRALLRYWLFGSSRPPSDAVTRAQQMYVDTSAVRASSFLPSLLAHDQGAALPVLGGVPTVVITGENDTTIPARHSRSIADQIANARLVVVPGAGHMVNLTHPDVVNAELERLLDEVTRGDVRRDQGSRG